MMFEYELFMSVQFTEKLSSNVGKARFGLGLSLKQPTRSKWSTMDPSNKTNKKNQGFK